LEGDDSAGLQPGGSFMPVGAQTGRSAKTGVQSLLHYHDTQVGQAAAAQVRQRCQVVQNPSPAGLQQRCGERLAAMPEAHQRISVPGGPMFIFTSLFGGTENEARLMSMLAHEMTHVILRHGTHEACKRLGLQVIWNLLGAAAAAQNPGAAELSRVGLGLGENSLILHFSREAESEADALGSRMMAEARYNPFEMARFFEKLASRGNQAIQFFSDHPSPENRERAIEAEIRALTKRDYGFETGDFARAKSEVAELPPPGAAASAVGLLGAATGPCIYG